MTQRTIRRLALSTTLCASFVAAPVLAQKVEPAADNQGGDIIVTAQKREQRLQDVPLSIVALDTKALADRGVANFDDYAKFLPSLSYASYGPGQAEVFFRGLSNGNRLSTGSLPTVGVYLDEQPVTTIGETLDVHIYDIARVEALAGPQGTLFGASSEAGTLRIITNKPEMGKFSGSVDLTGNHVDKGGFGGTVESYVNLPLAERVALRLVGFYEKRAGYIDNVAGPPGEVFPTSGVPRDNSALRGKDQNDVETFGGRAALGIELDDKWTVTPSAMYQKQVAHGTFAYRPSLGDLANARYTSEPLDDHWYQAALVIAGKLGRFDVTYAGAYFERTAEYTADYSDYAYFYDRAYAATPDYFGNAFFNDAGELIDPSQITTQHEDFTKQSHELRISSPSTDRFRLVAGLFYQRQTNNWTNLYTVPNLAASQSVTGRPGVNYANIQNRIDRDYAGFAEASFDLTPRLTATAGLRAYRYDNNVIGFFGFNAARSDVGEALCFPGTIGMYGAQRPCDNIDANAKGSGTRHKLNLSWKPADDKLLYATWSTGFRPGGINRRPVAPPYRAEELSNYELGWKTSWARGRVRFNGAFFLEKLTDAQFAVTSDQNGITDIINAGKAESKGIEADLTVIPIQGLSLQASGTYVEAKLTTDLTIAPAGTRFPNSPHFKLATTARYEFRFGETEAHVQGSLFHQSSVSPSLDVGEAAALSTQPGYTTADLSFGIERDSWSVELAAQNVFDKRAEQVRSSSCNIALCGPESILIYPIRPRYFSLRVGRKF